MTAPFQAASNRSPSTCLLVGRALPESGVDKKMRGLAASLERAGVKARVSVSAPRHLRGIVSAWRAIYPDSSGILFLRNDWALVFCLPLLAINRARGTRIVLEIPTPIRALLREATTASGAGRIEAILGAFLMHVSTCLIAPVASSVITYADDYRSIRALAGRRETRVGNGIDTASIGIREPATNSNTHQRVRLLGVGVHEKAHGLDRLLRGMAALAEEDPESVPDLVVAGEGRLRHTHEEYVRHVGLASRVTFEEHTTGPELAKLYNWADMGVGALALHRTHLEMASPIKHREYLARGLPILLTERDPWIAAPPSSVEFALVCPDEDSPINVRELISWVSGRQPHRTSHSARRFAEHALDFSITHLPLVLGTSHG